MAKRVTLEQIAEACGVTKGLVSRALAGKYNVSDEMRSIISQKAVELGYDFEKLRSKSHQTAKVLLVISSRILLKEDFWQPIIKAISATLDHNSVRLDYCVFDEKNIDDDLYKKIDNSDAKAFVLIHSNPEELVNYLITLRKPIVEVDPKVVHFTGVTQIKFSNYNSMYEATQMLIDKGHKNIAFYGSDMHATSFRERHEGFLACIDANKNVKGVSIIFNNDNLQYGDNEMFRTALKENKIDALVCANDIIALNAYRILKEFKLRVPEDISVVGFDNVRDGDIVSPRLCTFNVPREQLGNEVAKYLINLFMDKQLQYSQIVIRCTYIEKESVR